MMTRLLESGDSSRLSLADIHIDIHGVTDEPMNCQTDGLSHRGAMVHDPLFFPRA